MVRRFLLVLVLSSAVSCSSGPTTNGRLWSPPRSGGSSRRRGGADCQRALVGALQGRRASEAHHPSLAENRISVAIERIEEARALYGISRRRELSPQVDAVSTGAALRFSDGSLNAHSRRRQAGRRGRQHEKVKLRP